MQTHDLVREIALGVGWEATQPRSSWIYLSKQSDKLQPSSTTLKRSPTWLLRCWCHEGAAWIGDLARGVSPLQDDRHHRPKGPVLDIHMSDPGSIQALESYLKKKKSSA